MKNVSVIIPDELNNQLDLYKIKLKNSQLTNSGKITNSLIINDILSEFTTGSCDVVDFVDMFNGLFPALVTYICTKSNWQKVHTSGFSAIFKYLLSDVNYLQFYQNFDMSLVDAKLYFNIKDFENFNAFVLCHDVKDLSNEINLLEELYGFIVSESNIIDDYFYELSVNDNTMGFIVQNLSKLPIELIISDYFEDNKYSPYFSTYYKMIHRFILSVFYSLSSYFGYFLHTNSIQAFVLIYSFFIFFNQISNDKKIIDDAVREFLVDKPSDISKSFSSVLNLTDDATLISEFLCNVRIFIRKWFDLEMKIE